MIEDRDLKDKNQSSSLNQNKTNQMMSFKNILSKKNH